MLILSGIAVVTFSYFNKDEKGQKVEEGGIPIWVYYVGIFSIPFLYAGCTIAMKNMSKFHDIVVSWYLTWVTLAICLIASLLMKENYQVFKTFSW